MMNGFRRLLCACVLVGGALAIVASAASATTFYVNQRGANSKCAKPGAGACTKISEAIVQAEKTAGPNTIEVEPETGETTVYDETISLDSSKDNGLTITGEEEGVKLTGSVSVALNGAVTLSNMRVVREIGAGATIADDGAQLTLENMLVTNESGENGVEAEGSGSVTIDGGTLEMEDGASGYAVNATSVPLTLSGVTILNGAASQAEAGGVNSDKSTLTVTNTKIAIESGLSTVHFGIAASHDTSVSLQGDTVRQNTEAIGVVLEAAPATVDGLSIEMLNPSAITQGLDLETEPPAVTSTLAHVEVSGTWKGAALSATGEALTLSDSRLMQNAQNGRSALSYVGEGQRLILQRTRVEAAPGAQPGALNATDGNVTIDSSEILGGKDGVHFENTAAGTHTLTLAASTVDAGAAGIEGDAAGVTGVEAVAKSAPGSVANVAIEGSIVLERQSSSVATEDQATITCSYSAAPSQALAAGGGAGAISCAAGSGGDTEANPLSTLFAEPFTNYVLSPTSSAVDSVPTSAISLPEGIAPSTTDLADNPRVAGGNSGCVAVQDKGALELQGHSAACPAIVTPSTTVKPPPRPISPLGAITGLTISPGAFLPAPSGATIAKAKGKGKAKKKYGATIGWRDSQAATTTFTVVSEAKGRKQGKTCKQPSKANKHGKPCKLLVKKGSFTHVDVAGANSLRFSGRLNGKALAKGIYTLQAVPRNAAGSGVTVSKRFTVK
jgi:hypothetical protein